MPSIPKRASLVEEAVLSIREGLRSQTWLNYLPPERRLSEQLQISRPTLRLALAQMAREGAIKIEHGRKTKILVSDELEGGARPINTVVFVILRRMTNPKGLLIMRECEVALRTAGFLTEYCEQPYAHARDHASLLREMVSTRKNIIWLLVNAEQDQQKIFEQCGAHAIIFGCAHEGVRLPSVDLDYAAIASHALKTFYRLGHRLIHVVLPQKSLAGDLATEQGLKAVLDSAPFAKVRCAFSRTDGSPESMRRIMERILKLRPRPTGLFVMKPSHALTALTCLLKENIRVPEEASLICRDDEEHLAYAVPAIAAYKSDHRLEIRKIVQMVHFIAGGRWSKPRPLLFIPKFESRLTAAKNGH